MCNLYCERHIQCFLLLFLFFLICYKRREAISIVLPLLRFFSPEVAKKCSMLLVTIAVFNEEPIELIQGNPKVFFGQSCHIGSLITDIIKCLNELVLQTLLWNVIV